MIQGYLKRKALKSVLNFAFTASDDALIRAIDIVENYFIKEEETKKRAETVKTLLNNKSPVLKLAKDTFKGLSPQCRRKLIENFFINAAILGRQKQEEIEKKTGLGLPWYFVISPTARCNLKCAGCYAFEYEKHEGLSFEEVDRIIREAKELGIYFITVSGGEPFIWPHLLRMLEKHNDVYFQIYSNSTLITPDVARKLSKLGNAAIGISVEGFEKETDRRRGKGTYKKIKKAMSLLRKEGVLYGFSSTQTKLNSKSLTSDKFIDSMISLGCAFGWFFQYAPIGRKPDTYLMATPEQRNKLRMRVKEIRETKPIFIGDFWNDGPYVGGCMAGARSGGYFHINCNGDVEPCVFLQFSVDNIKGKKLIDVIHSPFFKAIVKEQPYCKNKNLLIPCALIDHPEILRKLVKKYKAKPSFSGGRDLIYDKKITKFLDSYAKKMKKISDPAWKKEFPNGPSKHWRERRIANGMKLKD